LNGNSYVRNARYKLTNKGNLFDLSEAPYKEIAIASDTADAGATAARKQLQAILDQHPTAPGVALEDAKAKKKAAKKKAREEKQ